MIRVEQKIEKLEKEVKMLRKELVEMRRIVKKEVFPVIIERISVSELTPEERKAMEKAVEDFRKGKMENFAKVEEI